MLKLVQDIKKKKNCPKNDTKVFFHACVRLTCHWRVFSVFLLLLRSVLRPCDHSLVTVPATVAFTFIHIFFFFFYSESAVKFTHYRGHGRLAFYLLILFDIFISQGLMHYTWRSYGPYKSSENGPGGDERRSELRTGSCSWDLTEAAS